MKKASFVFLSLLCVLAGLLSCADSLERVVAIQSTSKTIYTFDVIVAGTKVPAKIDTIERIITVTLPPLTDPKGLVAVMAISKNATVSPESGTKQDFDKELTYTVTAENGSSHSYRVITSVKPSDKNDITSFKFSDVTPEAVGVIDTATRIIYVKVPANTVLTKLTPTIKVSDKATVSPASGVAHDFSKDVIFTVTSESGKNKRYTVRVSIPINVNALIKTSYFPNDNFTIQGTNFLNPINRMTITFVNTKTGIKTVITNFVGNTTNLLFTVPNSLLPGTYNVIISTDDKQEVTLKETITITAPTNAPKITSVSKTELKPNDTLLINGQNFSTVTAQNTVRLVRSTGVEEALIVKTATATQLTITVPTDVKLDTFTGLRVEVTQRGSVLYTAVFTTTK